MKKTCLNIARIALVFVALALTSLSPHSVHARGNLRVQFCEGVFEIPGHEQQATIVNGQVLIPLRAVMEGLGFLVEWDSQSRSVAVATSEKNTIVQIGSYTMLVNEIPVRLDISPQIINGRAMVSTQTISEITGIVVLWNGGTVTLHILEPLPAVDYWPEHLPQHIPGSITLTPESRWYWSDLSPPRRFRSVFFTVPMEIMNLVECLDSRAQWMDIARSEVDEFTMLVMHFVQHFDISRADFDAAIERMTTAQARLTANPMIDINHETLEIPNADIVFTFDNDIIRYFYRRE